MIVTSQIEKDIVDFWEEYTKTHEVDKNIILFIVDMRGTLAMAVGKAMGLISDEFIKQREFKGKSAIEPAGGKE